ncbi:MAG: hypothetical protein M3P96_08680, partial [Actinomycetota bacterium]|nr:hypothetical protein [Actinomycetota bacterium]
MARTLRQGAAHSARRGVAVTGVAAALLAVTGLIPGVATPASAASRQFGPAVEAYGGYEPQLTCDPTPKAGTKGLADYLVRTYPGTGSLGISRRCDIGGRSEHKEGRAFDWAVDYDEPAQRAQAEAFFRWLLATDAYGNSHAMARRLGIMYVIWDGQIWSASSLEWRPYSGASAHRDHVHISLTWPGALGRTSFWTGQAAPTPAPAPAPAPHP